jgi:hypothetical protein
MGREVRLIVTGSISGKSFRRGTGDDGDLTYACTVQVSFVEAGEIA